MTSASRRPSALIAGYRRFRQERFAQEAERYRSLAQEQRPRTMVIGCADSRVDPATIFSAAPGELFIVRNVAALVPPCEDGGTYHGTSAALEFAVTALAVERIVILGHGMCGGVAAALSSTNRPAGRFIQPWVDILAPIRDDLLARNEPSGEADRQKALERLAIQHSISNLTTFPFIRDAVENERLQLHGAWFSIAEGELHWLDPHTKSFEVVSEA